MGRLNFKTFCSMHIMWELPISKPTALFNNTQEFNQSEHAVAIFFHFYDMIPVTDLMDESQK